MRESAKRIGWLSWVFRFHSSLRTPTLQIPEGNASEDDAISETACAR
jgi:hypothetical protein